jgi:UDP-glucose 4-epimerase
MPEISSETFSLVTGGAGFLGSHVAKHCLAAGHRVVILDNLSGGSLGNVPQGAVFVQGDVTDAQVLAQIFGTYNFDYVYHLAAYAAEGLSHFIRRFNYTNNVIGSVSLINEAVNHQIKCFVFTSSIAVYGAGQLPMSEDLTPKPEDPYGIAKYAVELDLAAARRSFGLNYVVFRPHNVYGENQNLSDPFRNVLGIFMRQIMNRERLTIFGDGLQTRAFSHIDDVAPYIASSVNVSQAYGEVINIGADTPYSVNQLAGMIAEGFGVPLDVEYLPARHEVLHAYANHKKARELLNATPRISLREGVKQMVNWAKSACSTERQLFKNVEISRGLPEKWLPYIERSEGE